MKNITNPRTVVLALLAAVFYTINSPFSKVLLNNAAPTFMKVYLYLGASAKTPLTNKSRNASVATV